ncbi:Hemerythrin HHE cation-binding domain containing protein [Ceratobasidium theobromae]|uniref:Hemerythrin HHE cation-binding domain containing protein n=1 Tax=Ceratobasidium theobromae TaxID=1582974 RepID=A0A5N5QNR6_9AGAM|nr:Hemerythrin HHE cation-binding domain containing protein [Ceratobasidium theobromae]
MTSYPYPLIPTPPGDWRNSLYDLHAIRMAAIHNMLIRGFNSVFYHAPNVPPKDVPSFMKYCRAIVELVHEHHATEETAAFPALEAKLGKGAMDSNIAQHQEMLPKFDKWADLCSKILSKDAKYDPTEFTNLLQESTDLMYAHLVDEIPTMESSLLQKHFSEAELRELEEVVAKRVQEQVSIWGMPLAIVNSDLSFNSWFPPVPGPVLFVIRHVVMNVMGDMWKYGQSDKYMRLKDEIKPMYSPE